MSTPSVAVHEVFPYLRVRDAVRAIEFYGRAFGATEQHRLVEPSGRVGHAELAFGATVIMPSDAFPEYGIAAPGEGHTSTSSIHLHADDRDRTNARAVEAGATLVRAPSDQFYGGRSGTVRDPFAHEWLIGHEIEALSPAEMQRRYTARTRPSNG